MSKLQTPVDLKAALEAAIADSSASDYDKGNILYLAESLAEQGRVTAQIELIRKALPTYDRNNLEHSTEFWLRDELDRLEVSEQ